MAGGEPDLNLLVALRALLEEANVTRAGERIRMGQSTMSSALSRLRALFEDELLVRIGREYELTPLARQLLPQVQTTLPLITKALGQEAGFDPASGSRAMTVLLSDYAEIEMRPLFAAIHAKAPGVRIELGRLPMNPMTAEHDLLGSDFIVAVPGIGFDLDGIEVFRDHYVVIADRDNPAVAGGSITLEDFQRLPHARVNWGALHTTPVERRMRELDIRVDIRVSASSIVPLATLVADTNLLALVPSRIADRLGSMIGIVAVPTPFPSVELIERLYWHPANAHDPAHIWFREMIGAALLHGTVARRGAR